MLFEWDDANIAHLARHNVTPHEAEEVLQNDPFDSGTDIVNDEERVNFTGETNAGRILEIVVVWKSMNTLRFVTAWEPSTAVKREYHRQRLDTWRQDW